MSDVTYELLDVAKNSKKIGHYDCLKKATVNLRPQLPEKSESDSESSTDDSLINDNFTTKQTKKRKSIASKAKPNNTTASAPENSVVKNISLDKQQDKRISKRATKGQVSGRYSPTLYMFAILFIIALVLSSAGASPVVPFESSETQISPILDGHTLWHP